MNLYREKDLNFEEKETAIYSLAFKNLRNFDVVEYQPMPDGLDLTMQSYRASDKKDQPALWKEITEQFKEYFFKKQKTYSDNLSNESFLKDMLKNFEKNGMQSYCLQVSEIIKRLESYRITGFLF